MIAGNTAETGTNGSFGGGIYSTGNVTLIGCVIARNTAQDGAYQSSGGGMAIDNGTLVNCTIAVNTATSNCGGVYTQSTDTPTAFINCLIFLNNSSNALTNNVVNECSDSTIKSSVIGYTPYDNTGTSGTQFSPPPLASDFNADWSLGPTASYAIKLGDASLYESAVNPILSTLGVAGGLPSAATGMLDINGNLIVSASGMIDIGAFRLPGDVTSVTVDPSSTLAWRGQAVLFTADVIATDGAGPSVTWTVNSTDSKIDSAGKLIISLDEPASTLTVTATSMENNTVYGTATVTVLDAPPAVTTVTANAGYGGEITNTGLDYTVTPNDGFVIDQVFVDGIEQTIDDWSTFVKTFQDDGITHSIFATFGYTVNFNTPTNGTLTVMSAGSSISDGTLVHGGQKLDITVTPSTGFTLESLTINNEDFTASYSGGYEYTVGYNGTSRTLSDNYGYPEILASGVNIDAETTALTYTISASTPTSFGSLQTPYTQPATKTVTVSNTGTGSVTLTQPISTDYIIGALSATDLAAGDTAKFTVQPKAGLSVGNHDETIMIQGSDGASTTVGLSFTVKAASASATDVTFTAVQTGGTSGTFDSTGIALTLSQNVTGLTAGNITITNGSGSAIKGTLVGSGASWTISLASVTAEGTVSVSIGDFGTFHVMSNPQTVEVFKRTADTGDFIPVTGITGVPSTATAGTPLTLSGTVTPSNATNRTITWMIKDAGTAGAALTDNILYTTGPGTVIVTATITDGETIGSHFTKDFTITVEANDAGSGDNGSGSSSSNVWILEVVVAAIVIGLGIFAVYDFYGRKKS